MEYIIDFHTIYQDKNETYHCWSFNNFDEAKHFLINLRADMIVDDIDQNGIKVYEDNKFKEIMNESL